MTDWIHTLNARQQGYEPGFLAADIPLEKQDQELGGPLSIPADDETAYPGGPLLSESADEPKDTGRLADAFARDEPADKKPPKGR